MHTKGERGGGLWGKRGGMGRENELWPGGTLGGGGGREGGGGFCHNKKCPLTALKGKTEGGHLHHQVLSIFAPAAQRSAQSYLQLPQGEGCSQKYFQVKEKYGKRNFVYPKGKFRRLVGQTLVFPLHSLLPSHIFRQTFSGFFFFRGEVGY